MSLSNLTFSQAEVPTRTRETGPNPFAEVVGSLTVGGPAQSFTIDGSKDEKDNKDLRDAIRLLRDAGQARDLTTRTKVDEVGTAKAPKVKVTFWVIDRITRPRKDAAENAEANGSVQAQIDGESAGEATVTE